jgi:hypothetical protein
VGRVGDGAHDELVPVRDQHCNGDGLSGPRVCVCPVGRLVSRPAGGERDAQQDNERPPPSPVSRSWHTSPAHGPSSIHSISTADIGSSTCGRPRPRTR